VVIGPCNDAGAPTSHAGGTAVLRTRRGIPASVALFGPRGSHIIYLAADAPVILQGHPLHRYLIGSRLRHPPPRTCRHHARLLGAWTIYGSFSGPAERTRLTPRTVVRGPAIDGLPRLVPGRRYRIAGDVCAGRNVVYATSVTPSP
jgi:hypothetical protein